MRTRAHPDDALEIRLQYRAGATIRGLSERHGYSTKTIHRIVTGKTHQDVPGPVSPAGQNRKGWSHLDPEQHAEFARKAGRISAEKRRKNPNFKPKTHQKPILCSNSS